MDVTAIINQVFNPFEYLIPIVLLAILLIAALLASANLKGLAGEAQVNFLAKWFLDNKQYHLIKNLTRLFPWLEKLNLCFRSRRRPLTTIKNKKSS